MIIRKSIFHKLNIICRIKNNKKLTKINFTINKIIYNVKRKVFNLIKYNNKN